MQKGRGAQHNPTNRFVQYEHETEPDYLNYLSAEGDDFDQRTEVIETHPKTIINKVVSPDVPMEWSMNPYQGCEHGCVYCYARPTHEFWGYSAGLDFERKILVKKNAAQLLETKLKSKAWQPSPIVLSGNTDCYQPLERKYKITRSCLEVFRKYNHPVGIITKNALIQRDLDILADLQKQNLIHVVMSVTTLDESLRRNLEPRTATVKMRLQTIERLTQIGIPVTVNMAPIIPGLNSSEVFDVLKAVKDAGASDATFIMVRLNGAVADVFQNWLAKAYPDKAEKVLSLIKSTHEGSLTNSTYKERMRGTGSYAQQIKDTFAIARKKHFGNAVSVKLNTNAFIRSSHSGQLNLF